jgi:hypothetical protein
MESSGYNTLTAMVLCMDTENALSKQDEQDLRTQLKAQYPKLYDDSVIVQPCLIADGAHR